MLVFRNAYENYWKNQKMTPNKVLTRMNLISESSILENSYSNLTLPIHKKMYRHLYK